MLYVVVGVGRLLQGDGCWENVAGDRVSIWKNITRRNRKLEKNCYVGR